MSTRLTSREINVIIDCLEWALAGEIDGGPLDNHESPQERDMNWRAAQMASEKLKERKR